MIKEEIVNYTNLNLFINVLLFLAFAPESEVFLF
jgi:hypothetical protein